MCEASQNSDYFSECEWISKLANEVHEVRNFITNHNLALSIFKRHSKLNLLKVADTRFASNIISAERLKAVKDALEKMVMDSDWKSFKEYGKVIEGRARAIKECIVNDNWWDQIDFFLSFTKPILDMLRAADKDSPPILHFIYDMWDSMIENVKKIIFEHEGLDVKSEKTSFFDAIHQILEARWNKRNTHLHCLAHSLVPKYYNEAWLQGGGNGVQRLSPNEDEEVSINRDKCFKRLFPNSNDLRKVYVEYGAFSTGLDYFNEPHVMNAREYKEPLSWWTNYGASTPLLQNLAFKLLSQPASSSCCERNWSTYSFIQSIKRNRMTSTRVEELVFVLSNLRLLSRKEEEYTKGPCKYWDLGGDNFDLEGNTLSEFQDLSLDDPVLESVIFEDEDNSEDEDENVQLLIEPSPNLV